MSTGRRCRRLQDAALLVKLHDHADKLADLLHKAMGEIVATNERLNAPSVPSQPKSRAATTESRYRPKLVGEVR